MAVYRLDAGTGKHRGAARLRKRFVFYIFCIGTRRGIQESHSRKAITRNGSLDAPNDHFPFFLFVYFFPLSFFSRFSLFSPLTDLTSFLSLKSLPFEMHQSEFVVKNIIVSLCLRTKGKLNDNGFIEITCSSKETEDAEWILPKS